MNAASPNYQRLFEGTPALLLILDPELNIVNATDGYLKATGTRREKVVGKPLFEVFPDNPWGPKAAGAENLTSSLKTVLETRLPHRMAVQKYNLPKEGDGAGQFVERYWSPVNSPVLGPDGRLEYVIHRVEDVTDSVRSQLATARNPSLSGSNGRSASEILKHAQDLQQLETLVSERTAQLRASVDELEAFCYSLSHDMRAPLRAIHGYIEIVMADGAETLGHEGLNYLQKALAAARRMDQLIQDVLAYTRLSHQAVTIGPIDTAQVVRDILEERAEFQPPNAEIKVQAPLLKVMGHNVSLIQCVTNLLANAVKFVARDVTPKITIRTECAGGCVRLWIEDNGIGIDPAAQKKLFAMFQRVHTGVEYDGTGIGLAIVRKAAERMHGKVAVISNPGQGSRFYLELQGAPT